MDEGGPFRKIEEACQIVLRIYTTYYNPSYQMPLTYRRQYLKASELKDYEKDSIVKRARILSDRSVFMFLRYENERAM
jgi:hypothetical protein